MPAPGFTPPGAGPTPGGFPPPGTGGPPGPPTGPPPGPPTGPPTGPPPGGFPPPAGGPPPGFPPPSDQPGAPSEKKRSSLPWVLGAIAILAVVLVAALAVFLLGSSSDDDCEGRSIGQDSSEDATLSGGEPDEWCVEVSGGRLLAAVTSDADTTLAVLDADGEELASDDDSGAGLDPLLDVELDDGTYTLVVSEFFEASDEDVAYTLAVGSAADELAAAAEDEDEGDTGGSGSTGAGGDESDCGSAPVVEPGDTHEGSIDEDEPDRVCLVIGEDGTRIEASVTSDDDTTLTILDVDGNEVAYNDDDDGLDPAIRTSLDEGAYFVEVDTWGEGGSDAYTLRIDG